MKKQLVIVGLCTIAIVAIGSIVYLAKTDGQMIFPRRSHGTFVQLPEVTEEDGIQKVRWILPEACIYVSYEVQEVGYTPNSDMLWGGGTEVPCVEQENGFLCETEAHPDMQERTSRWNIQASAYECESGEFYVSDVVTTN